MWLNDSTEKGSQHYIIIYHRIWNMFENSDRVYMSNKSIHVHVLYVCVHTLYMIVLTLQNSCVYAVCCVESLGQCIYGAGVREPSFTWGIIWHVARRTAVAAQLLSLRCEYAIRTSH